MNTKEFNEKLSKDTELQSKFAGISQPEKFYEVAKDNGLTDDFETMKNEFAQMVKTQSENGEIDIEKLTEISGGDTADTVSEVVSYISIASAATAGTAIVVSAATWAASAL